MGVKPKKSENLLYEAIAEPRFLIFLVLPNMVNPPIANLQHGLGCYKAIAKRRKRSSSKYIIRLADII